MLLIQRWSPQLVKLPCILVAIVGLQVATTPPYPPPSRSESVESTPLEFIIKQRTGQTTIKVSCFDIFLLQFNEHVSGVPQAICWTSALAEITVIVLNHVHQSDLSRTILSLLVLKNNPDEIRATPIFFLGTLLTGLGGYIRYRCYKEMGTMFTFEMSIRREHRLVTSGPYSVVRHPGYTGILCTVAGIILWNLSSVRTVHNAHPI
jgi:hypothetical protein